jgi:hypothetical protein
MSPVFSEYSNSFIALNAAIHNIDQMLQPRGRTGFTNRDAVREIVYEVIRASSGKFTRRHESEQIIRDILEGGIPRCESAERDPPSDSDWTW